MTSGNTCAARLARRGLAVVAAGIFIFPIVTQAQSAPAVVSASLLLPTDQVHPGAQTRAAVVARITPGFHINDHHPSLDYLIPTDLKLEPSRIFSVEKVSYPPGKTEKFAFSDTGLSVYEGEIVIRAALKVAHGIAPGAYPLRGQLEYQACNDHACLPPTSVPVSLTVRVAALSTPLRRVNPGVFRKLPPR
ncbi:MAG: protein-disulfide reductase DsbD domain-containing protein [Terriglobia bacterium]